MIKLFVLVCMLYEAGEVCHSMPPVEMLSGWECRQEGQRQQMEVSRQLFFEGQPHRVSFTCQEEGELL